MQLLAGEGGGGVILLDGSCRGMDGSVRQSAEKDEEDLKQRKVL